MPNFIYPTWKQDLIQGVANTALVGTATNNVKVALVSASLYTYNNANSFYANVSAGVIGTPQGLGANTYANGVFGSGNVTFTAVSGATVNALVIYVDTGTPGTSRLVAYLDTGITNLPVVPNGGNITVNWDQGVNRIFSL
jgi:hypothetical protein